MQAPPSLPQSGVAGLGAHTPSASLHGAELLSAADAAIGTG